MNLPTKQADGSGRFYEYVIDNIRQMIADGELQAGQKLPSERELAEKFNVSRVPIREALKILEYMGVLDSSPGDGTYVKNTSAQSLVSKMNFSFDATADTIRDLLELRIVLETFAAYHAAQRRTDEDIASIQKLLRDMREAKKVNDGTEESVQNLRKLSHGFHQALVRAAHNAVLSSVYEYLYELLDISRQFTSTTAASRPAPLWPTRPCSARSSRGTRRGRASAWRSTWRMCATTLNPPWEPITRDRRPRSAEPGANTNKEKIKRSPRGWRAGSVFQFDPSASRAVSSRSSTARMRSRGTRGEGFPSRMQDRKCPSSA